MYVCLSVFASELHYCYINSMFHVHYYDSAIKGTVFGCFLIFGIRFCATPHTILNRQKQKSSMVWGVAQKRIPNYLTLRKRFILLRNRNISFLSVLICPAFILSLSSNMSCVYTVFAKPSCPFIPFLTVILLYCIYNPPPQILFDYKVRTTKHSATLVVRIIILLRKE